MPLFGQIIVGPPGAGKSTYASAMQSYLQAQGRIVSVVNMDPANDRTPYEVDIDVRRLINIDDVMKCWTSGWLHIGGTMSNRTQFTFLRKKYKQLGPNGGLVYCMEYIESRIDWLREQLNIIEKRCSRTYLIMDFPGQIELFTHHDSALTKWGHRLTVVNLADSHYCIQPHTYISLVLTTLAEMIQLEMPQVNVLSKADLLKNFGPLPFRLEYFTEVHDLSHLLALLQDDPLLEPYKDLSKSLVGVIESYSLVQFQLLNIHDAQSMAKILCIVDKANGFVYHETDAPIDLRHAMKLGKKAEYDPLEIYDPNS